MTNNKTYYGITIGPIVKTLCMTSTPGGLWLASYIFSYIAKDLVIQIKDNGGEILIPHYKKDDEKEEEVGSYPDHVIFSSYKDMDINVYITKTKDRVTELLHLALIIDEKEIKKFVDQYINIRCIKTNKVENIMIDISEILDNVEQFDTYVYKETENYFLTLFNGKENDKNYYVKKFFKVLNEEGYHVKPQVCNINNNIKSVEDIAKIADKKEYKISNYFAIVQADGDGMTRLFSKMGTNEKEIKKFSQECINYTTEAAKVIKEYGGVTIYAGGDDLLFLAPLVSNNNMHENIFDLCTKIGKKIKVSNATVSFGVAVNYVKFPLYESFNQARDMLVRAKSMDKGEIKKNSLAFRLTKASGLSVFLNFGNETRTLAKYNKFIKNYYTVNDDLNEIKNNTNSVIYLIDNYKALYDLATKKSEKVIKNFFENMYDNPLQKKYNNFINEIIDLYISVKKDKINHRFISNVYQKNNDSNSVDTELSGMLRVAKFLVEKDGVKNDD